MHIFSQIIRDTSKGWSGGTNWSWSKGRLFVKLPSKILNSYENLQVRFQINRYYCKHNFNLDLITACALWTLHSGPGTQGPVKCLCLIHTLFLQGFIITEIVTMEIPQCWPMFADVKNVRDVISAPGNYNKCQRQFKSIWREKNLIVFDPLPIQIF